MVRFKNRFLLVEFLSPSDLVPSTSTSASSSTTPSSKPNTSEHLTTSYLDGNDEELIPLVPIVPFLLPRLNPIPQIRGKGDGGNGNGDSASIFRAIRGIIQDVFGDEGWGRVASSFKVVYHSTLTSITILRVARQHYRLVWAALTLVTRHSPSNSTVIPRVIAVSGTIKKVENHAIAYHRRVVAVLLAS
ncbi:ribonuclease P/MRP protein subunit, partial [Naematelia encephala]